MIKLQILDKHSA